MDYDRTEFQFRNKRGELVTFGSRVYYVKYSYGHIDIVTNLVNAIVLKRYPKEKKYLYPFVFTSTHLLGLDDCYKSYEDAQEVVNKWERKVAEAIDLATQF